MVEVLQIDRDAAAPFVISPESDRKIRNGEMDWNPVVQAFARHRIAARPLPDGGGVGEMVETLTLMAALEEMPFTDYHRRALTKAADMLAALAARPEGWREIGSAPKDGTVFLAIIIGTGAWEIASWNGVCFENTDGFETGKLTHWMPLPTPPERRP